MGGVGKKIVWALCGVMALATSARADEVVVAVGMSSPPYAIIDQQRGIEYDIVKRSLALAGHTMVPRPTHKSRTVKELEGGQVDVAMPVPFQADSKLFYSQPHIEYRNYAITLASNNITINSVADLTEHSVLAFQEASRSLGPDFQAMAGANGRYREEAKQVTQPILLFLGRTDVVVADAKIFNWFASSDEVKAKVDTNQQLRFHPIFPPTEYRVAFRDAQLRDAFDRGLKQLRDSGEYRQIVNSYSRTLASLDPR